MNDPLLTPQRYMRIRALFLQVCELDPLERSAILDSACADDRDLRSEVESLLREDSHASGIVGEHERRRQTVSALARNASMTALESLPCQFGRYRLLRVIGEGGMGTVYEAQQLHPHRMVALKLLRPGLTTAAMLRRFDYEAHVLGLLHHPGIAQIFEAGTADRGQGEQPFFAMELIHGQPLLKYAAAHALSVRQKLELMARICDAVQHAHTKGVVHRDLKPNNILIDESGQPKILDFGVARATDCDIQTTTLHTQVGQLVGTLAYMSPEQAGGNPDEVDTRSDVYSLGVICYELLCGRLPLELERKPLHEAVRMIREQEPPRLGALDRAFRGDIETIVGKMLEKEAERRYQSAGELAADIRRSLSDEPIAATPRSALDHVRRFARRHRSLVAALVATVALLLMGIVGTTYGLQMALHERDKAQAAELTAEARLKEVSAALREVEIQKSAAHEHLQRATDAQRRAETEARKATAVTSLFQNVIKGVNPTVAQGQDLTVRQMLDEAVDHVDVELRDEPETGAAIRLTIGQIYKALGNRSAAEEQLRMALQDLQPWGERRPDVITLRNDLGILLAEKGQLNTAAELFQSSLNLSREVLGPDHDATINALKGLAGVRRLQGRSAEAEPLLRDVLDTQRKTHRDDDPTVISTMNNLGLTLQDLGRLDEAESTLAAALAAAERGLGSSHPRTLGMMNSFGVLLHARGQFDRAESTLRTALEQSTKLLGAEHPNSLITEASLAVVLTSQGRLDEAEPLIRKIYDYRWEALGPTHPETLVSASNLSSIWCRQGKLDRAEQLTREVLEARTTTLGPEHPNTVLVQHNLAGILLGAKRATDAEPLARAALDAAGRANPPVPSRIAAFLSTHAACLRDLGRFDEAEPEYLDAYRLLREAHGDDFHQTRQAVRDLVHFYKTWGRAEKVSEFQALLQPQSTITDK